MNAQTHDSLYTVLHTIIQNNILSCIVLTINFRNTFFLLVCAIEKYQVLNTCVLWSQNRTQYLRKLKNVYRQKTGSTHNAHRNPKICRAQILRNHKAIIKSRYELWILNVDSDSKNANTVKRRNKNL